MDTRFLVASDLHGSAIGLTALMDRLERTHYDAVVMCGDITNFGPLSFASMALADMAGVGPEVFFVGGNCDPKDIAGLDREVGARNVCSLHGRGVTFRGLGLVGFGGSPGTGGTPGEYTEEEMAAGLESGAGMLPADRGGGDSPVDVVVTHAPARGSLDRTPSGERIGSTAVKAYVDRHRPAAALSGHVHQRRGTIRRGPTLYLNPGPLRELYLAELEVSVGGGGIRTAGRLLD